MGTTVKLRAWYSRKTKHCGKGVDGCVSRQDDEFAGIGGNEWNDSRKGRTYANRAVNKIWLADLYSLMIPTIYQWGNYWPTEWDMCVFFFSVAQVCTKNPQQGVQKRLHSLLWDMAKSCKIYAENPPFSIDSFSGPSEGMQLHSDWGTPSNCF